MSGRAARNLQRRESPGFDLTVSVYWADGEYALRAIRVSLPPTTLLPSFTNYTNLRHLECRHTHLGPTHLRLFARKFSPRGKPYTPVSMSCTRRSRAVCEARTADMCSLAGKNDDGKWFTGLGRNRPNVPAGTGFPSDSPRPFLSSDGVEVCSSRAIASGLRLVLDLISRLFSLHPPSRRTRTSSSRVSGRTDPRSSLSPYWLTPIRDALSSQFREERIPKLVSNR